MSYLLRSTCIGLTLLGSGLVRADDWQIVKSADGRIQALLPGPVQDTVEKTRSLAGYVVTRHQKFQSQRGKFHISCSRVPPFAFKVAGQERILENAKGGLLRRCLAKETSFKQTTINGTSGHVLRYVGHQPDQKQVGYEGYAVFFFHEKKLYIANAMTQKESGGADLAKFRKSIAIADESAKQKETRKE